MTRHREALRQASLEQFKNLKSSGLVLSFGSINADIVAYSRRLPRLGETIHGGNYAINLGGKRANQAAAGRLAGALGLRAEARPARLPQ